MSADSQPCTVLAISRFPQWATRKEADDRWNNPVSSQPGELNYMGWHKTEVAYVRDEKQPNTAARRSWPTPCAFFGHNQELPTKLPVEKTGELCGTLPQRSSQHGPAMKCGPTSLFCVLSTDPSQAVQT